ncbi:MAG: hypothetical protein M3Y29_06400 [Chloroflexota bacterium]|nr:hypothetical protein [Chloroflexota bacterium]
MTATPEPQPAAPITRPGPLGFIPLGFIPILPRSPGIGGTARDLADAERHDALMHLIEQADEAARSSRIPYSLSNDLHEAAARARRAFGVS